MNVCLNLEYYLKSKSQDRPYGVYSNPTAEGKTKNHDQQHQKTGQGQNTGSQTGPRDAQNEVNRNTHFQDQRGSEDLKE